MKKMALFSLVVLGAAAQAQATEQQNSAPVVQPLEKFAPLAFLAGKCWSGPMPDGKGRDTHCFEWLLGGHYLRDRHVVRTPGKPDYIGETLYYQDHERKQIAYLYYENGGAYAKGVLASEGERLLFPDAEFFYPGGKLVYRAEWQRVGEHSYRVRNDFLKDGKWVPQLSMTLEAVK